MTRSKAPLAMMEQMVMLLVFALAAALCLQAFVKSDEMSKGGEARDRAVTLCQNVAEVLRSNGGDPGEALRTVTGQCLTTDRGDFTARFDENWELIEPDRSFGAGEQYYFAWVSELDSGVPGLGKAEVYVESVAPTDGELTRIFELEVAWQEVSAHG